MKISILVFCVVWRFVGLFETVTTCFSHCLNTSVLGSIIWGEKRFCETPKTRNYCH